MDEKIVFKNWLRYADSVGDFNPIHIEKEAAERFGLGGIIAPGMYILSFLQKLGKIRSIDAKFLDIVRDEDIISIYKGMNFNIKVKEKVVAKGKISYGEPTEHNIEMPSGLDYIYRTDVNEGKIKDFILSIGAKIHMQRNPEMYLFSLSAPALLNYGKEKNRIGMHVTQSAEIHHSYKLGGVKIGIKEKGKRFGLEEFDLYWIQDDKVISSGKAMIKPLLS